MLGKIFQLKFGEKDLAELMTLVIGLTVISIIPRYFGFNQMNWYWIVLFLFILFLFARLVEELARYLLGKRNRQINVGYFVLAIVVIACINVFVIY